MTSLTPVLNPTAPLLKSERQIILLSLSWPWNIVFNPNVAEKQTFFLLAIIACWMKQTKKWRKIELFFQPFFILTWPSSVQTHKHVGWCCSLAADHSLPVSSGCQKETNSCSVKWHSLNVLASLSNTLHHLLLSLLVTKSSYLQSEIWHSRNALALSEYSGATLLEIFFFLNPSCSAVTLSSASSSVVAVSKGGSRGNWDGGDVMKYKEQRGAWSLDLLPQKPCLRPICCETESSKRKWHGNQGRSEYKVSEMNTLQL